MELQQGYRMGRWDIESSLLMMKKYYRDQKRMGMSTTLEEDTIRSLEESIEIEKAKEEVGRKYWKEIGYVNSGAVGYSAALDHLNHLIETEARGLARERVKSVSFNRECDEQLHYLAENARPGERIRLTIESTEEKSGTITGKLFYRKERNAKL